MFHIDNQDDYGKNIMLVQAHFKIPGAKPNIYICGCAEFINGMSLEFENEHKAYV